MVRIRGKIKHGIEPVQCDFVEGKDALNAIYSLRTPPERGREIQNEIYLCFIGYAEAFDCVKHQELINLIERLNIDRKGLRVIRNLYWQQIAAVLWEKELCEYKLMERVCTHS